MASYGQPIDAFDLIQRVRTLLVADLKMILRKENLQVSGQKRTLQERVIKLITEYANIGNMEGFERLRNLVYNPHGPSTIHQNYHLAPLSFVQQPPYGHGFNMGGGIAFPPAPRYQNHSRISARSQDIVFKESPFYTILQSLTPLVECKVRESTRDSVELIVPMPPDTVGRLQDPNMRIMIFCAMEGSKDVNGKTDILFPQQVEMKVNMEDVKTNLRGLKNKPGSTRPADITSYLRKRIGFDNIVTLTYALTQRKYFLIALLVQKHPVEDIVAIIKTGRRFTKEQVIQELQTSSRDSEVIATSTVMSLKCPLSTLRIDVPCRSTSCRHIACFDVTSYLLLQEQAPIWQCPLCYKPAPLHSLQIDEYVDDILKSTSKDEEHVTIEPDGVWRPGEHEKSTLRQNGTNSTSDDDDLIELTNGGSNMPRAESGISQYSMLGQTPPYGSREPSTASAPHSMSNKRSLSQVIDLTNSSDEDEPLPPAKRPAFDTLSSFIGYSRQPPSAADEPHLPPQALDSTGFTFSLPTRAVPPNIVDSSWGPFGNHSAEKQKDAGSNSNG